MQASDFKTDITGRVVPVHINSADCVAFVPNPLPPSVELTRKIILANSEADRTLSELAGVARTLPNPYLLINQFMRREAVLSSRIEGTQASLPDLLFFEVSQAEEPSGKSDVLEVRNYIRAMEYGLERLKTLPVSKRLIRELHERLMKGVRGQDKTPGEFRKIQNWIGARETPPENARYMPPPVTDLETCLDQFEKYVASEEDLPALIRLAFTHYQFEAIHPFADGNGRVGRLLITLLLCDWKILPQPLLYLSAYLESNRSAYYDKLLAVSQQGAWEDWVIYFLNGVAEQSRDGLKRALMLQALWMNYRERLQTERGTGIGLRLVDFLFSTPVITVSGAAKKLDITFTGASRHINNFVDKGILREVSGWRRNRIFLAPEILRIANADSAADLENQPEESKPQYPSGEAKDD